MRRLATFAVVALAVLWSLLCWAAYGLVGAVGGFAASNADWLPVPPEAVVFVSELMGPLTGVGLVGVVIFWAIGLVGIVLVGLLVRALGGRRDGGGRGPLMSRGPSWARAMVLRHAARRFTRGRF